MPGVRPGAGGALPIVKFLTIFGLKKISEVPIPRLLTGNLLEFPVGAAYQSGAIGIISQAGVLTPSLDYIYSIAYF